MDENHIAREMKVPFLLESFKTLIENCFPRAISFFLRRFRDIGVGVTRITHKSCGVKPVPRVVNRNWREMAGLRLIDENRVSNNFRKI